MTRGKSNPPLRKSAIHPIIAMTIMIPLFFAEPTAPQTNIHFIHLEEGMEPSSS